MTPQEFIAAIAPAAQASAIHTKIPASFTVAQAAIESGWGKKCPGFNLFGIKADKSWSGPTVTTGTHEYEGSVKVPITDRFRAYPDWQASIDDHARFLTENPRYQPAFQFQDGRRFASAVAAAGYATDPGYSTKIISIIDGRALAALDAA